MPEISRFYGIVIRMFLIRNFHAIAPLESPMRLLRFRNTAYRFSLSFADGRTLLVDLQPLIGARVSTQDLTSARIDAD